MNCLVAHLCLALCDPLDCSMPGFPVLHHFLELAQTHARWCHGRWCHPTILSSVIPFSSCHLCFPASRSFPMSQLFASGGQSFSFSISPSNDYSGLISFRIGWFDLLAVQESSPAPQFKSINSPVLSLLYGPNITSIHDYWKNHSLDYKNLYHKVMFLLFNTLSRFVIAFLRRSKSLLISWQGLLISCHLNELQGLPWWLRG